MNLDIYTPLFAKIEKKEIGRKFLLFNSNSGSSFISISKNENRDTKNQS